jgi:hypothetical protein
VTPLPTLLGFQLVLADEEQNLIPEVPVEVVPQAIADAPGLADVQRGGRDPTKESNKPVDDS